MNPISIVKAWIRFMATEPSEEEINRAKICKGCEFAKHSKFLDCVHGKVEEVSGLYCNKCKCPLVAKIKTKDKNQICEKWR